MLPRRNPSKEAVFAFYLFSVIAATSFVMAVVATLPLFDHLLALHLYHLMISTFACTFILAELAELLVDPAPTKYAWTLCMLAVGGNCLYVWSSSAYLQFNSGQGYMVGEFFLSLAYELKIVALLLHEKSMKQIMLL